MSRVAPRSPATPQPGRVISRFVAAMTCLIAGTAIACSDMSTEVDQPVAADVVRGGGTTQNLLPGDTLHFSITIDPSKNSSYDLGNGHTIYFPGGELCDPAKSTYGPTEWDKTCPKAVHSLTLQVTAWLDANGHPFEDFSPSVRFLPTTNPAKFVILSLTDPAASLDLSMNILYCATPTSPCINEALNDASLITNHDPLTGKVWRRIKHFSGYNVAAGDEAIDASLNRVGQKGGYMLASGRDSSSR